MLHSSNVSRMFCWLATISFLHLLRQLLLHRFQLFYGAVNTSPNLFYCLHEFLTSAIDNRNARISKVLRFLVLPVIHQHLIVPVERLHIIVKIVQTHLYLIHNLLRVTVQCTYRFVQEVHAVIPTLFQFLPETGIHPYHAFHLCMDVLVEFPARLFILLGFL